MISILNKYKERKKTFGTFIPVLFDSSLTFLILKISSICAFGRMQFFLFNAVHEITYVKYTCVFIYCIFFLFERSTSTVLNH